MKPGNMTSCILVIFHECPLSPLGRESLNVTLKKPSSEEVVVKAITSTPFKKAFGSKREHPIGGVS